MKKKLLSVLLTSALTVSVLAGCGSTQNTANGTDATETEETATTEETAATEEEDVTEETTATEENEEPVSLRAVAYNSIVAHLDSVIAHEAGIYEKNGLDVDLSYNNSNPDNIQALLEDKLDLVSAGATAVLNYIDQGSDIVIIGGQMSEGASVFVLPERQEEFSELNEETLAGKKVGVTRLNTGDIALRKYLKETGVDLSKIEFIELDSGSTVIEAVKNGEVDLGVCFLTFRETAEAQGLVPAAHLDDLWPGFICCRLFTTRDKLEANRDAYVKAVKANIEAYALIQEDHDTALSYALNAMEIEEDLLVDQIYDYGHLGLNPNPDIKNTTEFYNAMVDIGYSEGNVDIADYIDASLYEEALAQLLEEDPDNEIYQSLQADSEATNH